MGGDAFASVQAVRTQGIQHEYALGNAERAEGPWRVLYTRFNEVRPWQGSSLRRSETPVGAPPNIPERVTLVTDSVTAFKTPAGEVASLPMIHDDLQAYLTMLPDRALHLATSGTALRREAPVDRYGVLHDVVSFAHDGRRVRVELSRETHLPTAVEIVGAFPHDFRRALFGDVRLRTRYVNWTAEPRGIWWPRQYLVSLNDEPMRDLSLTSVSFDSTAAPPDSFAVHDSTRLRYATNRASSPPNFAFASRGAPEELRPGIIRMRDFWSMTAVRQDEGIVLFEAHLGPGYLSQVLDYLGRTHPGVPIKAIVLTSDPWAHLGGVREAVARGIPIYANARSIPFLEKLVKAPYTSTPDRLARAPRAPRFMPVSSKVSIGTGPNRLDLYPVGGAYAERMLMAHFPEHQLLYGADLVFADRQQKGYLRTPALDLRAAVERLGLVVESLFCVQPSPLIGWRDFVPAGE